MIFKASHRATLLLAVDLAGTFLLAVQGASIAADRDLDVLGIVVVSLSTAMGGGILRDVLIGASPPEAFRGWPVVTVALCGAVLAFSTRHVLDDVPDPLLTLVDALGLSLLAVVGAEKALEYRLSPVAAVMMGAVSGAGGYTIRDVLLAEVPSILRTDFLATPAVLGAVVLVLSRKARARADLAAFAGGATCFLLRLLAVWQHWKLPTGRW